MQKKDQRRREEADIIILGWNREKQRVSSLGCMDLEKKKIEVADKKQRALNVPEMEMADLIPSSCGF